MYITIFKMTSSEYYCSSSTSFLKTAEYRALALLEKLSWRHVKIDWILSGRLLSESWVCVVTVGSAVQLGAHTFEVERQTMTNIQCPTAALCVMCASNPRASVVPVEVFPDSVHAPYCSSLYYKCLKPYPCPPIQNWVADRADQVCDPSIQFCLH